MKFTSAKKYFIAFFCIAALAAALLGLTILRTEKKSAAPEPPSAPAKLAETPPDDQPKNSERGVLGLSVEGREIESYSYGNGIKRIVFVGGIHGGYEWNSVVLAYELTDYLKQNPDVIPENAAVTVIPNVNPDGVFKVIGKEGRFSAAEVPGGSKESGRLNARSVDLNRNFDCNWKPEGVWRESPVSGGTAPFSEPESAAIKKFVLENKPAAVIFWHSQSDAIYGSQCGADMLSETVEIMNAYSAASGYRTAATFDQYAVSGDATDWLASINIPAMTVELKTHETIEWNRNLSGIKALFKYYGSKK